MSNLLRIIVLTVNLQSTLTDIDAAQHALDFAIGDYPFKLFVCLVPSLNIPADEHSFIRC